MICVEELAVFYVVEGTIFKNTKMLMNLGKVRRRWNYTNGYRNNPHRPFNDTLGSIYYHHIT